MRFEAFGLEGAYVIHLDRNEDERGFLARTFSVEEFAAQGLEVAVAQSSISSSPVKGTMRGMHYQAEPHGEAKLIRCAQGNIFDAAIDLRPDSPTYGRAAWIELAGASLISLYLPRGVAHGYLTLSNDVMVSYQMSGPYVPDSVRGVRWNDPHFAIPWPEPIIIISERDSTYPDFES